MGRNNNFLAGVYEIPRAHHFSGRHRQRGVAIPCCPCLAKKSLNRIVQKAGREVEQSLIYKFKIDLNLTCGLASHMGSLMIHTLKAENCDIAKSLK